MGYDALLVMSFGGPEGPDDVMPFLENVVRGRGVPRERLLAVAEHYMHFGGVSPINQQCRDLIAALKADFAANGLDLPIYWGNRNWHPMMADTLAQMKADGIRTALGFATSAYGGYSSCRQYWEDIDKAQAAVEGAPEIHKLRQFWDHPGFVEPHADALRDALATLDPARRETTRVVFTAHSIPNSMAATAGPTGGRYEAQLMETAALVAERAGGGVEWDLVWQSRSGPPQVPWLEPDINDHLTALAEKGVTDVAVSPIGFVSDHLEVLWDLDNEARETADELGLGYARAGTPGHDPRYVTMVRELVLERLSEPETDGVRAPFTAAEPVCVSTPGRRLGSIPVWDYCAVDCCKPPARPAR